MGASYEEYNLFEQRKATSWLIPLTRQLRVALPRENGYYLSHARERLTRYEHRLILS